MTKESVFTVARGSHTVQALRSINTASRYPQLAIPVPIGFFLHTLALILLLSLSNLALAQTLVIDINVVGLNVNQTTATEQLGQACDSSDAATSEQTAALQALCDQIDLLDQNDPDDAIRLQEITDAVAPEEVFALNDSLSIVSVYQTSNVQARLNSLRNPVLENNNKSKNQPSESIWDPIKDGEETQEGGGASADLVSPLGGFVNGHVSSGQFDGGRLQQDSNIASSSLTIGGDYRFNEKVVAGLGIGFVQDEARFRRVIGGTQSDGFNLTAFASWYETDEGYLDLVLDFGRTDFSLERPISTEPDGTLIATSAPAATATSLTVGGGRNFKPFGLDLSGYFRLSYTGATIDGYSESLKVQQPGFAALFSVNDQTVVSKKMVIGLNLSKAFSFKRTVLLPLLRIEYVSENDRKKEAVEATLITTGTTASYQGEDRVDGYSNLALGASVLFSGGKSAYAFYETHLQHDVISQDWLKTGIRLEF